MKLADYITVDANQDHVIAGITGKKVKTPDSGPLETLVTNRRMEILDLLKNTPVLASQIFDQESADEFFSHYSHIQVETVEELLLLQYELVAQFLSASRFIVQSLGPRDLPSADERRKIIREMKETLHKKHEHD